MHDVRHFLADRLHDGRVSLFDRDPERALAAARRLQHVAPDDADAAAIETAIAKVERGQGKSNGKSRKR